MCEESKDDRTAHSCRQPPPVPEEIEVPPLTEWKIEESDSGNYILWVIGILFVVGFIAAVLADKTGCH